MPDIQTALKTAISRTLQQWDDDGEESPQASPTINTTISNSLSTPSQNIQGIPMINQHKITNNVSRETFNYVKNNPGSTRMEIITALGHEGFGKSSVSALLSQMRRSAMAHDTNGLWYADVNEYQPIKTERKKKKIALKKSAPKKTSTGLGALLKAKIENPLMPNPSQDAMDAAAYAMGGQVRVDRPVLTKLVRTQTPEQIIGNMTVYQAHDLYKHLKQMFGG